MELALISLAVLSGLELLLWAGPVWQLHKPLAAIYLVILSFLSGIILVNYFSLWAGLITLLSLYRVINLLRIVEGRMHADYLYHATRRTSLWLIGLQAAVYGSAWLIEASHVSALSGFYALAAVSFVVGLVVLASTLRHLKTTTPPVVKTGLAEHDLPTLTVAIPARNETEALEACLKSLLASTYPKLEILVLDDCSQNKRTPEIIRQFAHDGVRFMAGEVPPGQWLAKNYAYAQMADEANGELLLFCGVDTRFEPGSLTELVKIMHFKHKTMISLLPRNVLAGRHRTLSLLVQPSRYAWELALPRRLLNRPPVLSSCWLISRAALEAAGGFAAVSRKTVPESYLARATAAGGDGYSFLQATPALGISSHKNLEEQRATAVRTRYPQLHRRPELVALVSLAELLALIWPLGLLIISLIAEEWGLAVLAGLAYAMQAVVFAKLVNLTYRRFVWPGVWLLPFAAVYDIGLLNYSMWQYEFREVIWKGRNVCLPVMRVIPNLPKI